ncbi:hypothetical protein FA95DRAFT_1022715 [Auriscalpium vulgare]|uniref:Uncharacterized protein n=1 Tax=Auriscalpium vulgare TaxID=40419 RepID=A0ACB8RXG9_9AGAM|nr:hypothetical protein FA95DRAFT_1022715 [Auriscalpium vulgare]
MVWGQLPGFVQGMKSTQRDGMPPRPDTPCAHSWNFRVAARRGKWKVAFVDRHTWGADGPDPGDALRTVADADPAEWAPEWARRWKMYMRGIQMDQFHQDASKWGRLDKYAGGAMFVADAERAPEVLKLIARPSDLDTRMKSSSLYPPAEPFKDSQPFGCHLILPEGQGYEIGRLAFSGAKSDIFPQDDELVAFWYDNRHWPYSEEELTDEPEIERISR